MGRFLAWALLEGKANTWLSPSNYSVPARPHVRAGELQRGVSELIVKDAFAGLARDDG